MKTLLKAMMSAAVLSGSASAHAIPMALESDGVIWTWSSEDIGEETGYISLYADVTNSTLGGDPAYLHAFSLKKPEAQGYDTFDIKTATIASTDPNSSGWQWLDSELNAGGCNPQGGTKFNFCFEDKTALELSDAADFMIKLYFEMESGDVLTDTLHLKVDWVTVASLPEPECWKNNGGHEICSNPKWVNYKTGDLISQDFLASPPDTPPDTPVPLPGTLGLLGLGLVSLRLCRRHRYIL